MSSLNVGPDGAELLDLALPKIRLVKPIFAINAKVCSQPQHTFDSSGRLDAD